MVSRGNSDSWPQTLQKIQRLREVLPCIFVMNSNSFAQSLEHFGHLAVFGTLPIDDHPLSAIHPRSHTPNIVPMATPHSADISISGQIETLFLHSGHIYSSTSDSLKNDLPATCEVILTCPVCNSAPLTLSRRLKDLDICVCEACGTSLSVPHEALRNRLSNQS